MQEERSKQRSTQPGISFYPESGKINIHKSTFRALGEPDYFRFMYNSDDKKLAVQGCGVSDPGYHKKPKLSQDSDSYKISGMNLIKLLYRGGKWADKDSRRIWGQFLETAGIVVFDLAAAEKIVWDEGEDDVNEHSAEE